MADSGAIPCGAHEIVSSDSTCVPEAWYCGPTYYNAGGDDGCDCDCGVRDPDCDLQGVPTWCYNAGRPRRVGACGECPGTLTLSEEPPSP
ncbi:MAG TPA: hypothetical protein VFH51_06505 [Myxococcota bacterium]|nr:hypothetical protein [Myxococcota bacterium]